MLTCCWPPTLSCPLLPCLLRRMLEVTGGSMSTTFKNAGHDFPALYAVSHHSTAAHYTTPPPHPPSSVRPRSRPQPRPTRSCP